MKVGMLSFAHMHAFSYAENLLKHKDVSITSIWDADKSRGTDMGQKFQSTFYSNLDDFLASDIEVVIICSENVNHKAHVIAAAEAGKDILCDCRFGAFIP